MRRMRAVPLLTLAAAGCLWLPLGSDAVPRIGLDEVRRASTAGIERTARPGAEPGARGWFFEDSLIAFRTQATAEAVRFRVWNKDAGVIRVLWDAGSGGEPRGKCPAQVVAWELRRSGGRSPASVLRPGESLEEHAVAVARVPMLDGGLWRAVPLACLAGDPGAARVPLRLEVEAGGAMHRYTFWYGVPAAR
ncbi:MAG TPA: hypothetical protein VFR81_08095 [Longimicrobium sp.]|nr:hypothetical protein [Longimicrobium sp.]